MERRVCDNSKQIIDKNFDYMIKNYYSKFEFKYNWDRNVLVSDYLKRLFLNSFMEDYSIRNDLPILIHDLETYLAVGINNKFINQDNILSIYRILKASLNTISYTNEENTLSAHTSNRIILNKNINKYLRSEKESSLSPDELRRLYFYTELSNKIININNDEFVDKYLNTYEKILNEKGIEFDSKIDESLVRDGIEMVYESIAQNFGETILYLSLNKDRPKYKVTFEEGYPIVTNYEQNGIYQKPTIELGKTLSGINSKSDLETLLNMARVSLETSLTEYIASQYNMLSKDKYYDLVKLYLNFGIIKRNKYKNESSILKLDIKRVFTLIDVIAKRNLNNNLVLIDEIKPINVDKYLNA